MEKLKKAIFGLALVAIAISVMPSCKAKRMITEPPRASDATPPPTPDKPKVQAVPPTAPPPMTNLGPQTVEKPDYTFVNIQFEFNSAILKTSSIETLDKVAAVMKMDASVKFMLNGNSSSEGTAKHNMELSVQRAAAVKAYLVNSGISSSNLTAKGFGESKPITSNDTEEGKALNRRVEIKVAQ